MKPFILPAILEQSFESVIGKVQCVDDVSDTVQIDVVDGVYAPTVTWPFTVLQDVSEVSDTHKDLIKEVQRLYTVRTSFEIDLMNS